MINEKVDYDKIFKQMIEDKLSIREAADIYNYSYSALYSALYKRKGSEIYDLVIDINKQSVINNKYLRTIRDIKRRENEYTKHLETEKDLKIFLEQMAHEYITTDIYFYQLAEKYGIRREFVSKLLLNYLPNYNKELYEKILDVRNVGSITNKRKHKFSCIKISPDKHEERVAAIREMIENNLEIYDVCAKLNISYSALNNWIEKMKYINNDLYTDYKNCIKANYITRSYRKIINYLNDKNDPNIGVLKNKNDLENFIKKLAIEIIENKKDYNYLVKKYNLSKSVISRYFNVQLPSIDNELYEKIKKLNELNSSNGLNKAMEINSIRFTNINKMRNEENKKYKKDINELVDVLRKKK